MTLIERNRELEVAMQTRLGELCGKGTPTPEQLKQARDEAEHHVAACEMEE
jgi:hypothetical protein